MKYICKNFDFNKTYYKVTNKEENHNEYQYYDGLNEDPNKWNTAPCSAGGFYFVDIENIFEWLEYGNVTGYYVREVHVPSNAKVHIETDYCSTTKYKANKIILGKRFELRNINTIKYLVYHGADLRIDRRISEGNPVKWATKHGHLDIVKYLIEQGANIHSDYEDALHQACEYGHLDIAKYLVEHGADIHVLNDYAFRLACEHGHLDIVKYLVELGVDIHANNNRALQIAAKHGHLDIDKYLKSLE